jgi:hypothetical protein
MKRIFLRIGKSLSFDRKIRWSEIIAILVLCITFLSYIETRKAHHDTKEALQESSAENIDIKSYRLTESYDVDVLYLVSTTRTMPSPWFVRVFWVITVINNSSRDVSICEYNIKPVNSDLPSSGPYGEPYEQGLFDLITNEPISLPIAIATGHAIRFKVRSFLVILPNIPIKYIGPWQQGPPGKVSLFRFFYDYFASQGIDFFGNPVSTGPRGIEPINKRDAINQELSFLIRSGRGTSRITTLRWYDEDR